MSQTGLTKPGLSRVRDVLTRHVDSGAIPGLTALISRDDDVHVEVLGTMGMESSRPMRRDAIFRLASTTKPIVAAAAMILIEDCRLRLDDPVDPFLPELANRRVLRTRFSDLADTVPALRAITLRDLLTFRLGLGIFFDDPAPPISDAIWAGNISFNPNPHDAPAPDEWMRRLGELPLAYQPGERWLYNLGADVLAVLIARAAGQSLQTFMQERLFGPLGMVDTGFFVPPAEADRLTDRYETDPDSGELVLADPGAESVYLRPPAFPSGGAGLVSTLDDLAAFARMLLNKGTLNGTRVLSPASVALMNTDQLTPEQKQHSELLPGYWESRGWAFGLEVDTYRSNIWQTPGRYGWDGGFGTSWHNDPAEGLITILLTQASFTSAFVPAYLRDFWTATYQALED